MNVETRPNFLSINSNNSICLGDNLTLNADFVGDTASIYTWSASTGVTLPAGQHIIVSPVLTTTYTVTATYANGHSQVASKTVAVNLIPSVTILGSNFCDQILTQ